MGYIIVVPESKANFEESQIIIKTLSSGLKNYALVRLSEEKIDALWNRIQSIAFANDITETEIKPKPLFFTNRKIWSIAASVLITVLALSIWLYQNITSNKTNLIDNKEIGFSGISSKQKISNQTKISKNIRLSDGSSVILSPNSELSYPKNFQKDSRKVKLVGTAVFDVAHNASKPFFVCTNDVVTKVLGTKFKIITDKIQTNVSVLSGKVSVEKLVDNSKSSAIILLPNQQVIYSTANNNFLKTLVQEPILLSSSDQKNAFIYDSVPLKTVFESLEKAYGINIIYDEKNLENCSLTADLNSQSLIVKLKFICEALSLKYEILDGQIVLTGGGCD